MDAQSQKTSVLKDKIQINLIFSSLWKSKRKYIIPLAVTFVAACVIALSIPRFYKVQVMLAPEYGGTTTGTSGLKSITSMMGLGSSGSSVDAITPMFYPDLMKSTDFVVPLLSMQVSTADNGFKGTLLEYKTKHNKAPWWEMIKGKIIEECEILGKAIGFPVTTVSMHRPSKMILDADLSIPGIINSYGSVFFKGFKYISDSRRRWREPVEDIIRSLGYQRLHILTHPFWYGQEEADIHRSIREFVNHANEERYRTMSENITDIGSIMDLNEVLHE